MLRVATGERAARALHVVSEPQHQLLMARLAGFLVGRDRVEGRDVHAFLAAEQLRVATLLAGPHTTLEERIGFVAHQTFAIPIERLGLGAAWTRALRAARIPTLGRLLQYSAYDLRAVVSSDAMEQIGRALVDETLDVVLRMLSRRHGPSGGRKPA